MPPAYSYSETVFGKVLRAHQHEQRVDAPAGDDRHGLAHRPGAGDMQARILARREIEPGVVPVLHHHPVGADVEIAGVGIARYDGVAGASVIAAVERPVARDRQFGESISLPVSVFAKHAASLAGTSFGSVRFFIFSLVRRMSSTVWRIRVLLQRKCDAPHARAVDVPQVTRADGAFLESLRRVEQDGGRGLLLGDEIADGAHLLLDVDRLLDRDELADILRALQPFAQVLDRAVGDGRRDALVHDASRFPRNLVYAAAGAAPPLFMPSGAAR